MKTVQFITFYHQDMRLKDMPTAPRNTKTDRNADRYERLDLLDNRSLEEPP
jgi:hypothetical protein